MLTRTTISNQECGFVFLDALGGERIQQKSTIEVDQCAARVEKNDAFDLG